MGFKTFRLLLSKEKATFERDSNLEVLNLAESRFSDCCIARGEEVKNLKISFHMCTGL